MVERQKCVFRIIPRSGTSRASSLGFLHRRRRPAMSKRAGSHVVFGMPAYVLYANEVGNIPYDISEEQLVNVFSEAGRVVAFRLVNDREQGKFKGYGFCEYEGL